MPKKEKKERKAAFGDASNVVPVKEEENEESFQEKSDEDEPKIKKGFYKSSIHRARVLYILLAKGAKKLFVQI